MNGRHQSSTVPGRGNELDVEHIQAVAKARRAQQEWNPNQRIFDRKGPEANPVASPDFVIESMPPIDYIKNILVLRVQTEQRPEQAADVGAVAGSVAFGRVTIDSDSHPRRAQNAPWPEKVTFTVLIRMTRSSQSDQLRM